MTYLKDKFKSDISIFILSLKFSNFISKLAFIFYLFKLWEITKWIQNFFDDRVSERYSY